MCVHEIIYNRVKHQGCLIKYLYINHVYTHNFIFFWAYLTFREMKNLRLKSLDFVAKFNHSNEIGILSLGANLGASTLLR